MERLAISLPPNAAELSETDAIEWARGEARRQGFDPIGKPTAKRVLAKVQIGGRVKWTWRVTWDDAKKLTSDGLG